jgi:hypothetical protein
MSFIQPPKVENFEKRNYGGNGGNRGLEYRNQTTNFLMQMYGEWSLWHANFPSFSGPNRVLVCIFPEGMLEITYLHNVGPFLLKDYQMGKYRFLFPSKISKKISKKISNDEFSIMKGSSSSSVEVHFYHRRYQLLSIFGVGLDNLPIHYKVPRNVKKKLDVHVVGRDDLFLRVKTGKDENNIEASLFYHLVRCIRNDQPTVNVPLSTLVFTQVMGIIIANFVNDLWCYITSLVMEIQKIK